MILLSGGWSNRKCSIISYLFFFIKFIFFFPYIILLFLKKIIVGLWDHLALCMSMYLFIPAPINYWMPEPILMVLAWARLNGVLINRSYQSLYVCLSLLSLLGNDSVDTFPRQRIHNNRRIVGLVVGVRNPYLIKGESVGLSVYSPIVARS
jgi:hypothetical protein